MVVVTRETQLFQVVLALGTTGSFTRLLDGWQQQCHQNRDNRDYNQQFDKRESAIQRTLLHNELQIRKRTNTTKLLNQPPRLQR